MNNTGDISTKYRLSVRTTSRLKSLIIAIADIEGVSVSDTIHKLYRDKLTSLQESGIDLPDTATREIDRHFDLLMLVG